MEIEDKGGSQPHSVAITRKELVDALRNRCPRLFQSVECKNTAIEIVKNRFNLNVCDKNTETCIENAMKYFLKVFKDKWIKCHRTYNQLLSNNAKWLAGKVTITISDPMKTVGRPCKTFSKSGIKSQRKRVRDLVDKRSPEELAYAAKSSLHSAGRRDAAKIIEEAVFTTPRRATKLKRAYIASQKETEVFSPLEALALFIDLGLSKHGYLMLRSRLAAKELNVLPSYDQLLEAKKQCLPPEEAIKVTETGAEIKLQALLDVTTSGLAEVQQEAFQQLSDKTTDNLQLIYKWGFDGSSGQQQYKQCLINPSSESTSDENLFLTSIVPIQLSGQVENNKTIIWQNPRVSSTRYCRPIRFEYVKESVAVTKSEIERMELEIRNLVPTKVMVAQQEFYIEHKLVMTMIDGKICNAITDTSSQVCYICGASPKNMNNLEAVKQLRPKPELYNFGLSTLHAYIRFFECILHVAYRLDIQKWQVRGAEDKKRMADRKKYITEKFRRETGLVVDQPRQGSGSSNDGNTARRFFANHQQSAEITGVNCDVIRRFGVILQALSSGFDINTEEFKKYSISTAELFVQLYGWFYMPPSVHKILLHGADVIEHLILPIGQLSEEAQEARNKDYRNIREYHTRKSSRLNTNTDLFNYMLISSDPILGSFRPLPKKNRSALSEEVLSMLKCPDINV